jgi:glycosyltransferase involved in cell wall biosynthesis
VLVSAIIPVYNGAPFVREAIESVLAQTYSPIECLVIDDGSTDDTPAILATFGSSISVVRQSNAGVSSARNTGVRAARGDAVAFLDADDCWTPDKIERQVAALRGFPNVGLVYSGFEVVDAELRPLHRIMPSRWEDRMWGVVLLEGLGIGLSFTGMIRREVFDVVGPFDVRLSTSADAEYAWRVSRQFDVLGVDAPLALYRQHGRSQMHDDLAALEHDVKLMIEGATAELGESRRRRGLANLHTQLAARYLRRGEVRAAGRHLVVAVGEDPRRLVLLPLAALGRRVTRVVLRRWPARPVHDSSVVA